MRKLSHLQTHVGPKCVQDVIRTCKITIRCIFYEWAKFRIMLRI